MRPARTALWIFFGASVAWAGVETYLLGNPRWLGWDSVQWTATGILVAGFLFLGYNNVKPEHPAQTTGASAAEAASERLGFKDPSGVTRPIRVYAGYTGEVDQLGSRPSGSMGRTRTSKAVDKIFLSR